MKQIKEAIIENTLKKVFLFSSFLLISSILPTFVHSQFITGPIINAVLILSCITLGTTEAVLLGMLPSTIALSSGLLPLPLAPMVPFIMLGNAIYVLTFAYFKDKNSALGITLGSALKFGFLISMANLVLINLLSKDLSSKISIMLSWPQLITALLGGALALLVTQIIKTKNE